MRISEIIGSSENPFYISNLYKTSEVLAEEFRNKLNVDVSIGQGRYKGVIGKSLLITSKAGGFNATDLNSILLTFFDLGQESVILKDTDASLYYLFDLLKNEAVAKGTSEDIVIDKDSTEDYTLFKGAAYKITFRGLNDEEDNSPTGS